MNSMLTLENVNNVLLFIVIVLLVVLISKRYSEKFQDTCNSSSRGVSNIDECTEKNFGKVVDSLDGNRYKCGFTDGYGFPCL
jgi:hypothetical protein